MNDVNICILTYPKFGHGLLTLDTQLDISLNVTCFEVYIILGNCFDRLDNIGDTS